MEKISLAFNDAPKWGAQPMWGSTPHFFILIAGLRNHMNSALQDIVNQEIAQLGFSVFEIKQRGTRSRPILEVRITRHDGEGVTIEDCARASRAIEARLDADKTLGEFYTLEVSSPGIRDDVEINWKR